MSQQLATQLYTAGVGVFPCLANKKPAVPRGDSWKTHATLDPATVRWASGVVGVPVPQGACVIDLDTYKGVTRADVEAHLGCALPWDAAHIQTTMQGGQHYAFSVDWVVRFGSSLDGVKGLDTRTAGHGYIATGEGNTWAGFGVLAFAHPASLPSLPDACRHILEDIPLERATPELPEGDRDTDAIVGALRHVDPSCTRTGWVKVGMALRNHFHDDATAGLALFEMWSAGEFWQDGSETPVNYVAEHIETQWSSFKAEGDTTIGSLFYEAIQGGWLPPPTLDTTAAFGAGAAPAGDFRALVDQITEHGSDPSYTAELASQVAAFSCAPLQRAALLATLNRELKDAGLLTKAVRQQFDEQAAGPTLPKATGQYGKNHTENALQYVEAHYPDSTLARVDQVFYRYNGKAWEEVSDEKLRHLLATDMAPSWPQHSTVTGTFSMICELVHAADRKMGALPANFILFQNGVLDMTTWQLHPHHPSYFTTNIMPYAYDPGAGCPHWQSFLNEVFEGDTERADLLQEWFGYMLSGSYAFHKIMIMIGPSRSGKGTIGRVLEQVVGAQNFTGGSFSQFAKDPFMESIRDKPVLFMGDAEKTVAHNIVNQVIERVKTISGGDSVTFGRKYKSTLSERLPCRITAACNGVPRLFDDSGALASRLLVLPFELSFLGREDPQLVHRLLAEVEGIGVWALRGMSRLNAQGAFTVPRASEVEMQYIAESYSPLEAFIGEVCELGGDAVTFCDEAYDAYRAYAVQHQESRIMAPRTFTAAFKDAVRGRGCRYGTQRRGEDRRNGFKGLTLPRPAAGTAAAFKPMAVT